MVWINLGWYPVILLMYVAGIAALAKSKYDALKMILQTKIRVKHQYGGNAISVVIPATLGIVKVNENFKNLPGRERNYTPLSEHLFEILRPRLDDLFYLGEDYETLFDRFETFVALVCADLMDRDWCPPGRFTWKYRDQVYGDSPLRDLIEEAKKAGDSWAPIKEGFFSGSYSRFEEVAKRVEKRIGETGWI